MIGAMLLFVEAISLHAAKMSSTVTYVMGVIASLCLGVVAVVASNEDNIVHSGILKAVTVMLNNCESYRSVSPWQLVDCMPTINESTAS